MQINKRRARELLSKSQLQSLFVEELGWDRYSGSLIVNVADEPVQLRGLAQKRGMVVFECPTAAGLWMPDYARRRKIEHQVSKSVHEHLIVFTDAARKTQIWQWVKREPGQPTACREHTIHASQPGDGLLQKLEAIAFTLEEEEGLSLVDVTSRARRGLGVERVTKRFYDRFQKEHSIFLTFVSGITQSGDREWYASVMLNRLMFVYFIQRKGFLDGDRDYLRNRLARLRSEHGNDRFYSFYRYFLLRLFHEGLGGQARPAQLESLLGNVPYLNGGLFDIHELERPERYGDAIEIPDKAFERIFDYFDAYHWQLDERPLRRDDEINPDVLGYIFEKYINQKQMGAYYTKEDITEYISRNTVVPFLLNATREKCRIAFDNVAGPTVWDLLKDDPDRYVYPALRHGTNEPLPVEIEKGVSPASLGHLVKNSSVSAIGVRQGWNTVAPPTHGLPTETWREVVDRRARYSAIRGRLTTGSICRIDDLITFNLNVRQFLQDIIENSEGPDLLRAVWRTIENVSVLDPTCGSGAFLFAALNILEPLYESCLDRMQGFVDDLERTDETSRPDKLSDFRKTLQRVAAHPNRRYFILKSIILNNLFGVDIMEEAVEICKLRLFLKLVAQVEPDSKHANFGIEPLPDVDFNVRCGNTLVGYPTLEAVHRALSGKLDFENATKSIAMRAAELQKAFDLFRSHQTEENASWSSADKRGLRGRLNDLVEELNRHLAREHGVDPNKTASLAAWTRSHQPFHWFVEFHGVLNDGGFDIVVGNPPFVEYSPNSVPYRIDPEVFATYSSGNLYSYVFERSKHLTRDGGFVGLIVQISAVSTPTMASMAREVQARVRDVWISNFATRPSCLFEGVTMNLSIIVSCVAKKEVEQSPRVYTTRYLRWSPAFRPYLFETIPLVSAEGAHRLFEFAIPKLTNGLELLTLNKVSDQQARLALYLAPRNRLTKEKLFYRTAGGRYFKIFSDRDFGSESKSNKSKCFTSEYSRYVMIAVLSSSLWWWYYTLHFDMYNCKDYMMFGFPFAYPAAARAAKLAKLGRQLADDLFANAESKTQSYSTTGERHQIIFRPSLSKSIIDLIDIELAQHYGLTENELDFVVNYDIKFRMGVDQETDAD